MAGISRFSRLKKRHRLLAFFRMIRPGNLLMIALCQVLVSAKLFDAPFWAQPFGLRNLLFMLLSTGFSAASGYLINDYYDVKIDVVNKPRRVVVGKSISRRQTMLLHLGFIFIALAFAFLLGKQVFAVVAFSSAWLWLYSNQLKRMPFIGNFSVSLLTALAVYLPDLIFPGPKSALGLFALFAFWISLIREVVKDMEDMKGDSRHGCKTLPILWGIRKTKWFLYMIGILFVATFGLALFSMPLSWILGALSFAPPLFYLFYLLYKADTIRAFSHLSQVCKGIMLLGMVSILFL